MSAIIDQRQYGELNLKIMDNRISMGEVAAQEAGSYLKGALEKQEEVSCLFAAAPSQQEFLAALAAYPDIAWERVVAFQMDDYIGLTRKDEASFGAFLDRAIFLQLPFKRVYYISELGKGVDPIQEYTDFLKEHPLDLVFMGIGENGHIAFNDPHVADFNDPAMMKIVKLDEKSRQQQVHDGCFPELSAVPKQAYTLTIPVIINAGVRFCIVPSALKAPAIRAAAEGPVTTKCPASILQKTKNSYMYIDSDAASLLKGVNTQK